MRWLSCALAVLSYAPIGLAAPTSDECVDASTAGQSLRLHHRLLDARKPFETCASVSCPGIVRAECEKRLTELDRATPTVLLVAKDPSGDLSAVSVTIDGKSLATSLRGAAVAVDPGEHQLTFSARGHEPLTRAVVVREGEKAHIVSAEWDTTPVITEDVQAAKPVRVYPFRTAGIIIGVVGLVGVALGAVFGVGSYVTWGSVKNECLQAATCNLPQATTDRDTAVGFATASDVAFVAGGVLVATGAALMFVMAPKSHVAPMVGQGTLGLAFRGWF